MTDGQQGESQRQANAASHAIQRPEKAVWKMMRQKCQNPRNRDFKSFGERGIRVCDRWSGTDGFANFLADVGDQPFVGAGLDRHDVDGHFEPGNVYWADTRTRNLHSHDGRSMSLAAWAREIGMNERTLRARLARGWSLEEALTRRLAMLARDDRTTAFIKWFDEYTASIE